jgi:NADPH-dependent curcumin reductase CurA
MNLAHGKPPAIDAGHCPVRVAAPSVGAMKTVHLVARPDGFPRAEQFRIVAGATPTPGAGEALVENVYLSVDPYMRQLMDGGWELDRPVDRGRVIGRVVASEDPALPVGELVFHVGGWATHAVLRSGQPGVRVLRPAEGVPLAAYLSILGGTGLTAYVGLVEIARLAPGETVYVSAAAGGVGSAAGRLARLLGAGRIVGSAGSPAKVAHLRDDLGFDAAFDYHDGPVADLLAAAAPGGVDVALDNVGGEHLDAALASMRDRGRIAWAGGISGYHDRSVPHAPRHLYEVVSRSLRLEGFLVRDYPHLRPALEELVVPHLRAGRIGVDATVVDGFDNVVEAFLGVLRGDNTGKMLVRL